RPEIIAAYLYGSYAKGCARDDSDIDIAVMTRPGFDLGPSYNYMFDLESEVNGTVQSADPKTPSVEVIPLAFMNYPLKYKSSLFGKLFYCADTDQRVAEELRLENEFEDLKPFHDLQYRQMIVDVKERLGKNG
ncbi:MAG: nucleotidyltransferase domain-containing protein, partial [bacterium]|nr:nucleotidyltransferase domain-containing protein [bacterium]